MASGYYQGPGTELGSRARGYTRESDDAHNIFPTDFRGSDEPWDRRSSARKELGRAEEDGLVPQRSSW